MCCQGQQHSSYEADGPGTPPLVMQGFFDEEAMCELSLTKSTYALLLSQVITPSQPGNSNELMNLQ